MFLRLNNDDLKAFRGGTADATIQDRPIKLGIEQIWTTADKFYINVDWAAELLGNGTWQRIHEYDNRTLPYNDAEHCALESGPGGKKIIRCMCEDCKEKAFQIILTPPDKHGTWSYKRACGVTSSSDPQR